MGIDPGAGSEGRREEASSLKPPNWTPSSDPHKHPSFLAFLRARARCPPLKYKKLHPAPQPPWGRDWLGTEVGPARPGKVGEAPRKRATKCHYTQRLAPWQEGGPRVGAGWQALTASAHVPCRPGRGLPKTVVPLLAPPGQVRPLNCLFGFCLWSSWTESRLRPLTS